MKGELEGAFSAMAFMGAGDFISSEQLNYEEGIAVHGVVGCVTSSASGGKCGPGALSVAFSQALAPITKSTFINDPFDGVMVSSVVGGTASILGGGKFANGAETAAFGYIFNGLVHMWLGTTATYSLGNYLNERDGGGWTINQGAIFGISFGRPDLVGPDGQTYEIKTDFCLSTLSCKNDAVDQLNTYITAGNGLKTGDTFTVFRGMPFIDAEGVTMDVDVTFRYSPGPQSGLIGYSVVDAQPVIVSVLQNFFSRIKTTTTNQNNYVSPYFNPTNIPISP